MRQKPGGCTAIRRAPEVPESAPEVSERAANRSRTAWRRSSAPECPGSAAASARASATAAGYAGVSKHLWILLAANPLADPAPGLAARSLLSLLFHRLSPGSTGAVAAPDARAALEAVAQNKLAWPGSVTFLYAGSSTLSPGHSYPVVRCSAMFDCCQ